MNGVSCLVFSEQGSNSFNKFLTLLGDRVKLKGWDKFKAGLDVKSKLSMDFSIFIIVVVITIIIINSSSRALQQKKSPTSVCLVFVAFPFKYCQINLGFIWQYIKGNISKVILQMLT